MLIPLEIYSCRGYAEHSVCKIAVMAVGEQQHVSMSSIARLVLEVLKFAETRYVPDGKFKFSLLLAGWKHMRYMTALTMKGRAMTDLLSAKLVRERGELAKSSVIAKALQQHWVTFRIVGTRNKDRFVCTHEEDFPSIRVEEWNATYSPLKDLRDTLNKQGIGHLQRFDTTAEWPIIVRDGMCAKLGVKVIEV